jgi:hypothetical protein
MEVDPGAVVLTQVGRSLHVLDVDLVSSRFAS